MAQMTGKDWVVVALVIIITVLLSTMSSWWGQLVFTVGFKMALLIVSIVITVLVVALIAMMIANPGWWDNLFSTALNNTNQLLDAAGQQLAKQSQALGQGLAALIKPLFGFIICGTGLFFVYKLFVERKSDDKIK